MSAGSAFASGVRAGQAIWNSAVNNAMAGKRLDMLKTQFQFEQTQRKKELDNELASESTFDKFVDYLPTAVSSGEIDFSTPEGREHYSSLKSSVEPNISRDPATWKRYEAFSKEFEDKEGYPVFKAHERTILNIGVTWDQNNPGMPRPQIEDPKTGEMVDNTNQMDEDNYSRTIKRKQREAESKYGGGGMSQFFGSKPSELSPGVRERYIIARNNYFDKATATKDSEKIVEASYVWGDAPGQSETESLGKYKFTTDRLSELSKLIEGETTGPISGMWRKFKAGLGLDDKALLINAQITKIIPGLARGVFGEVGVLTDQDVAMYSKTIGNLNTPEEVNEALTKAAMDMVARGFENKLSTLARSRKNVSGYIDQLRDVKKQSSELLGIEEPETPIIEVENLPQSGAVGLTDEQAAAARAAAGPDGRVKVREVGTDIIREINVNPPTEETVEEAPAELVPAPAPSSDEQFEEANRLYEAGQFDEAIALYRAAEAGYGVSGEETPPAPAPSPDKSLEDFNVWRTKHLQDFPPTEEQLASQAGGLKWIEDFKWASDNISGIKPEHDATWRQQYAEAYANSTGGHAEKEAKARNILEKAWDLSRPKKLDWTSADINKERSAKFKTKSNPVERRKLEARIELYENRLAEVVAEKRGRISQTSEEKKLRTRIAEAEEALKKL